MQNQCKLTCYTSTRKLKANVMTAVATCYSQKSIFEKSLHIKNFM